MLFLDRRHGSVNDGILSILMLRRATREWRCSEHVHEIVAAGVAVAVDPVEAGRLSLLDEVLQGVARTKTLNGSVAVVDPAPIARVAPDNDLWQFEFGKSGAFAHGFIQSLPTGRRVGSRVVDACRSPLIEAARSRVKPSCRLKDFQRPSGTCRGPFKEINSD